MTKVKKILLGALLACITLWILASLSGIFEKHEYAQTEKTIEIGKPGPLSTGKKTEHSIPGKTDNEPFPIHNTVAKAAQESSLPKNKVTAKLQNFPTSVIVQTPVDTDRTIPGVTFVKAVMKPMSYELDERFWGWRPNDILNITDNVNSFQLGVLEVTRRTSVILAERISRTGSSASFDVHLERAMNWFMIKADRYWFPAPESKYHAGLKELDTYMANLKNHKASFYTRADNLLPLLKSYENLLGSCDENLVKIHEEGGGKVSFFKADNYFYYAQGVANTMVTLLEAIEKEFHTIIAARNGLGLLHHAHQMCKMASEIDPWVITNSDLSGVLANHRANMAAPISHARFYIGVLIITLST